MDTSRGRWVTVAVVTASVAASWFEGAPARAQTPEPSVTLEASRETVRFGRTIRLSGVASPATPGETIRIVDQDDVTKKETTTDDAGAYSVLFTPGRNITLHAESLSADSEPVTIRVRAIITGGLSDVRLFDRALVRGALAPRHEGRRVIVRLYRWGKVVAWRKVELRNGRYFRTRILIRRPGRYRALVTFDDADHLQARAWSRRRKTPLPSLGSGARSIYVKLLEKRLAQLHYRIAGIDRFYDFRTADAVRAFNKVQRRERLGTVGRGTWRALATPVRARPRRTRPNYHIEVDQTRQVLYRVRNGKVITIVHVSTGANGYTRDGAFTFYRQINGYSGGRLYHPSYFDGLRAIHGWPEVPTYPASHGCVRVPMWTAKWIRERISIGDRIYVYH